MLRFNVCVILILELFDGHRYSDAVSIAAGDSNKYSRLSSDILYSSPHGLASLGWSGISSRTQCAIKTTSRFSGSKGFLYNPGTETCTPLLWLYQGSGGSTLEPADVQQWELFINNCPCPGEFEVYNYGNQGDFSCLKQLKPAATYGSATTTCNNLGGYLTSVKTYDKLEMIVGIAQSKNHWVGMDDLAQEGVHRWQEDNQRLTTQQRLAVFKPGEPNNGWNVEDCVHYRGSHRNLSDLHCWATMFALCETAPLSVAC